MNQFRQDTGTLRPVRRNYYDPASAPGKGVVWEWENDHGSWTPYDMDVGITIQHAFEKQRPWIDLSPIGFGYVIDFGTMGQINRQTQRQRRHVTLNEERALLNICPDALASKDPFQASDAGRAAHSTCYRVGAGAQVFVSASDRKVWQRDGSRRNAAGPVSTLAKGSLLGPLAGVPGACHRGRGTLMWRQRAQAPVTQGPQRGVTGVDPEGHSPGFSPPPGTPLEGDRTLLPAPSSQATLGEPSGEIGLFPPSPDQVNLLVQFVGTKVAFVLQIAAPYQPEWGPQRWVPTVPVKNLSGSSPVNPALAGITGILMSAAGLPVCLTRPPKLVLHPPPVSKSEIKSIPGVSNTSRKTTKKQAKKGKTPEEVLKKYLQKVRHPPDEDCTICMERLTAPSGYKGPQPTVKPDLVGKLSRCGHVYHVYCLVAMYNNGNKDGSLQCPTCKTIYGVKTGTQPPGKMEYHVIPHSLPGHPDCRTIRIIYSIPPGIQGPEHPNPGKSFSARGFPRHCYLPDSEKGRKVLKLLLVAWDRRLIFAIGTSSTTGESDTVIWNEVHHKTEFGSNLTGHGYPDANYLDNVLAELAAQGISEDSAAQEKN
nr:PREDICTED: E3 ubiquitin-protein ligase DTX4 [Bos mutus]